MGISLVFHLSPDLYAFLLFLLLLLLDLVIDFVVEILLYFAKYVVEILICTICWNNGINHSSFNQVTI